MKILNILKTIKEYQVSILIAFIIVSILYGIHMFRYEYIINGVSDSSTSQTIYRVDRITNEVCLYVYTNYAYTESMYGKLKTCEGETIRSIFDVLEESKSDYSIEAIQ